MQQLIDNNNNYYNISVASNQKRRLNADGSLSLVIIENDQTKSFIKNIGKMWRIRGINNSNDKQEYIFVNVQRTAPKEKQIVTITAREYQFDYLANDRIYETIDGSHTATAYFDKVFAGTPFNYMLQDNVSAVTWTNAGEGDTRLTAFQNGLNRYGLEFTFDWISKRFTLVALIKREPAYYLSKRLNANNLKIEEDATEFFTYIRGYGNYSDEDGPKAAALTMEYTHPLATLVGKRHAEPIKDGRITKEDTMSKKMVEALEDSLKLTIELDFVSLIKQYPFAQPELGDYINVLDPDMQYQTKVRIIEIETNRNAKHEVISRKLTLGQPDKISRYQSATNNVVNTVNGWIDGKGELPVDVLGPAIKAATDRLTTSITRFETTQAGLLAIDPTNPNLVTLFSSAGIGVSDDGGQTFSQAITGLGINATLITTGALNANLIKTGSLDATLITTGTLNADLIKTGTLNASLIRTGTLDASLIKTGTLDASLIKTGSLDASLIRTGSLDASLIKTGQLSADRISGGVLSSVNGNMSLDLNTGQFIIGNNSITYTNPGNAMKYTANGWTSGIVFNYDTGGNSSMVLGSSKTTPNLDNNHYTFTGFKSIPVDESAQIWGAKALFVEDTSGTNADQVWQIDINQNPNTPTGTRSILPIKYKGLLGAPNFYFEGVYSRNLNDLSLYSNGIVDKVKRNGIIITDDTVYFRYKGTSYDLVHILRTSNFNV